MKKLAIIGGAGQMGVLFATYFQNKNYDVILYDINNDKAISTSKKLGVSSTSNIKKAITHSEIVIVSVPLEKTPDVISKISSLMSKGALLIEISSLKSNVLGVMRDLSRFKVQPLSIHPLIGPGVKNLKGQNLVVIPIKDPDGEIEIAKQLFYDMSIDDMECEKHDEIKDRHFLDSWMSIIQVTDKDEIQGEERLRYVEREAVKISLNNLLTFPWLKDRVDSGDLKLHGWLFDLEAGMLLSYGRPDSWEQL